MGNYASPAIRTWRHALPAVGRRGDLIDPIAQAMMKLFPEPTANMANPTIYDNWIASGASSYPNDQFDIKIDHRFSQKQPAEREVLAAVEQLLPFNCFGNFADPCAGGPNETAAHLFTINDEHTFSKTLLLTATLGFTRALEQILAYNGAGGVTDPLSKLGFPSYLNSNGSRAFPPCSSTRAPTTPPATPPSAATPTATTQGQDTGQLTWP
jgi:hypothetical protein